MQLEQPERARLALPTPYNIAVLKRYLSIGMFWWTLRVLSCLLTLLWIFRAEIGSSFSMLLGDSLDGQIQTSIIYHWYNVFRGQETWNVTRYFYPWSDTLGYNDGYFINGIFFSIARFFGSDPFLASEIATILFRVIGFFAFEAFAVNVMALGFGWALLGAVLFTLANNIYLQSAHGQLLTVGFAPLLGLLLWQGLQALTPRARVRSGLRATLWGCSAALLYAAWLLTSFYMAWFMTLFVTLVILAAVSQEIAGLGVGWRAWRSVMAWPLIPVGATLLVGITPFLIVYLPKASETGGHSFAAALHYAPALLDLLHVGSQNLVFGAVDHWIAQSLRHGVDDYGELTIGFPPLIAGLAIAGAVLCWFMRGRTTLLVRSMALATVVSFAILVHVGPLTLWYLIFHFFPGGSGVRVISRYALFLTFPVVVLAMSVLQAHARNWPILIVVAVIALLVAEEITVTTSNVNLDRHAEMRLLTATPTPPPTCRAFFIEAPSNRPSTGSEALDSLYPHNVDAMMLAEALVLPTINGFSTFNPPDWNFQSIDKPDYLFHVARYVHEHNIQSGLCGLDLARHAWNIAPVLSIARVAFGTTVDLGKHAGDNGRYLDHGWGPPDESGRLLDTSAAKLFLGLDPLQLPKRDIQLQIDAIGQSALNGTPTPITVEVNGTVIATWHPQRGSQILKAIIPARLIGADNQLYIQFRVVPPVTSLFVRAPKGSKRLGLFVHSFRLILDPVEDAPAGSP